MITYEILVKRCFIPKHEMVPEYPDKQGNPTPHSFWVKRPVLGKRSGKPQKRPILIRQMMLYGDFAIAQIFRITRIFRKDVEYYVVSYLEKNQRGRFENQPKEGRWMRHESLNRRELTMWLSRVFADPQRAETAVAELQPEEGE